MLLISPTEPKEIRSLGKVSTVPERNGVDVLFSISERLIGVQRKTFPNDFLLSLYDGRLQREILQMSKLSGVILLLEGKPRWTIDGALLDDNRQFTKKQFRGIIWSLALEAGVLVDYTNSLQDTVEWLCMLQNWLKKRSHISLVRRPNPHGAWGEKVTGKNLAIHFLQGLPDVGPKLAEAIYDRFGRLPINWTCTEREFSTIPGIGKKRLEKLWNIWQVFNK